ncbi:TRAP transporter small permease [Sutcliffiella cohnii]|uniref:TRAP transporter small permease n=1 Tax=Sutcliffiella cohnii TaxID=33932 RepID=UPI002E1D6835|nr:TRAP transporter small permease [Sutcliffiella cohnii]
MKKKFEHFEEYILVLSLALMVALIFAQVIGRYIFSSAPSWTEEMARYIHIFQVWIGASYAVKKRQHIRVGAFVELFKGTSRKMLELLALVLWFGIALFLAIFGTQLVLASIRYGQVTPAMQIPMWIPFLSIPLGGAGMSIRLIQQMIIIWRTNYDDPKKEMTT